MLGSLYRLVGYLFRESRRDTPDRINHVNECPACYENIDLSMDECPECGYKIADCSPYGAK